MPGERSLVIPVWDWWLKEARELLQQDTRRDGGLAADFHRALGATEKGARSYLSKFRRGKSGPTLALIDVLCREYVSLPRPIISPKSHDEALELENAARRIRVKRNEDPEERIPPYEDYEDLPAPTKPRANKLKGTAMDEYRSLIEKSKPRR